MVLIKIGSFYQFNCIGCQSTYIGETKKRLISRITEHGNEKHGSAISKHIYSNCENYKSKLFAEYSVDNLKDLSTDQKVNFIKGCFSLKQSNLSKYNLRKTVEAIEIKLKKPRLNQQVFSRTVNIF